MSDEEITPLKRKKKILENCIRKTALKKKSIQAKDLIMPLSNSSMKFPFPTESNSDQKIKLFSSYNNATNGVYFQPCNVLHKEEQRVCPVCCINLNFLHGVSPQAHINQCLDRGPEFEKGYCSADSSCSLSDVEHFRQYKHNISKKTLEDHSKSVKPADSACVSKTPVPKIPNTLKQTPISQYFTCVKKAEITNKCTMKLPIKNENIRNPSAAQESTCKDKRVKREKPNQIKKQRNNKKQCPFYKKIPDTNFTVDAFSYGEIIDCKCYFLTHFHSDHYKGLSKNFIGKIYCSRITANLLFAKLYINPDNVVVLPMNETVVVDKVQITLFDANHCPGSVMFLFELPHKRILHVGDFRANKSIINQRKFIEPRIDELYLDTTYCDPKYTFPTQHDVIEFVVKTARRYIEENKKTLVVCGSYTIGKERVFRAIADDLQLKVGVTEDRMVILCCIDDQELKHKLTLNFKEAQLHVIPMYMLTLKNLTSHLEKYRSYERLLAFKPTGWTYNKLIKTMDDVIPLTSGNITTYGVHYSEHSSFNELKDFVETLRPTKIIPTVNVSSKQSRDKISEYFKAWLR